MLFSSYGMSAEEFNTISTNLNNDPILKQRIMLQAYYYKYSIIFFGRESSIFIFYQNNVLFV